MILKKRVLLVGPINDQGLGGRFEEMRVWARLLEQENYEVNVFSMFNSRFSLENAQMHESVHLFFPTIWKLFPNLRQFILRAWGSKFFRTERNHFYNSERWRNFADSFHHIILFITHQSRELRIFEADLAVPVSIRFTGTIHDYLPLKNHGKQQYSAFRNYVIHAPELFPDFENGISKTYIDQTTLLEQTLLGLKVDSNLRVFAMIGLFMEVKKMEEIITLFSRLPDHTLILFGTGSLRATYQNRIDELDLSNVKIGGFIAPEKISDVYSKIDALIINSSEETGPMTGIEAMASGKIIFSRPVGAMRTRLNNSDLIYGIPEELFKKITKYSTFPPEKILEIKSDIRRRYLENYSNAQLKRQIVTMLDQSIRK